MKTRTTTELNPLDEYSETEISELANKTFQVVPNNTFKRDDILTEQVIVNGKPTGICVIQDLENKGAWKSTIRYQVMPHSRIVKIVEQVADELGIKLTMIQQPVMVRSFKYKYNQQGAVIGDKGRYMLASFKAQRTVDVSDDPNSPDIVETGITIVNTMDGTTALHTVPFTLRLSCMNQFHGFMNTVKGWQGNIEGKHFEHILEKVKLAWSNNIKLQQRYLTPTLFMEALVKRQTHTKSLNEDMLGEKIALQLELAVGFANDFKDLAKTPLTTEMAYKICNEMPVTVNEQLKCISVIRVKAEKKGDKPYNVISGLEATDGSSDQIPSTVTERDLFEDLTRILTHDEDVMSSSLTSQLKRHATICRMFNFGNRRQSEIIAR